MIDPYDIQVFRRWLRLAQTKGTDTIKVVCCDCGAGCYKVTIIPPTAVIDGLVAGKPPV